ncbi:ATP-binding protein [Paenibacillus sp. J5C_2022]|uniref:sensor histidine kinase n=1 Tax=Paenibacillus sp. J5C2022 TaxID=2977129 RepID=UPI0021D365DD|nr:ATP-binding protein [Paenibacillus sp. J5C2022]MCU6709640.1 ATP-binding protein [Paenibacillus sp. J5C2022]
MKDNIVSRLVVRSAVNIVLSAILSLVVLWLGYFILDTLSKTMGYYGYRNMFSDIMSTNLGLMLAFILYLAVALLLFCFLQWMAFRYFGAINESVRRVADGQLGLEYQIAVRKRSPFGLLAANVNRLSQRLSLALEEERRAEQTKNELITNVSHDLRTPLTSVLGYLALIEQDRYRDEVELRHYTAIAYEKSQRLHVLINDLFEYTRMRHDSVAIKMEVINLVEFLGQLLVQYHLPLQEAGLEAKLDSRETAVAVQADTSLLLRVFENLLSNAMVYGKDGKFIQLAVRREQGNGMAVVEVINYGDPIPALDLPHIFDRFYRGDKSRTQWSGGSGLGLAISKNIVEKHGGTIEAFSNAIETKFVVALPLAREI